MVKIFYGVNGQGLGHTMRSMPILEHLSKKHDLRIFASGRAGKYLKKYYNIHHINHYKIVYVNNKVSSILTFLRGFVHSPILWIYNTKVGFYMIKDRPSLAISDFEPATVWWANILGVPLVNIDNQHTIVGTEIDLPKKEKRSYLFLKAVIKFLVPHADRYISTTFFFNKKTKKNLDLVPPILRKEILELKPKNGNHILVYQTSRSNKRLIPTLKGIDEKFIVYGLGKDRIDGNIEFKRRNELSFYNDLSSCKAVITNGGFTLIGEALYLGKPVFSNVIGGQFEQIVNGYYIDKLGYGIMRIRISKKEVENFINNLEVYRKNIRLYKKEDNTLLFNIIDEIISKLE
ncbi:MJ1255/VC2487 family glycosyltransferase [Nanoarchaeota archaeon]